MKPSEESRNLHNRLHKIIGQVQAVDRMIDEDTSCENILIQINAARAALLKCGKIILEEHIHNCGAEGVESGDFEKTIENISTAVERFTDMS